MIIESESEKYDNIECIKKIQYCGGATMCDVLMT